MDFERDLERDRDRLEELDKLDIDDKDFLLGAEESSFIFSQPGSRIHFANTQI